MPGRRGGVVCDCDPGRTVRRGAAYCRPNRRLCSSAGSVVHRRWSGIDGTDLPTRPPLCLPPRGFA